MKILMSICSGIIMTGVAYSLYNAANDYGLATISLPPAITAQNDDTSGGDKTSGKGDETNGGPCEGLNIYCKMRMDVQPFTYNRKSNANKEITVLGKTIYTSKAETLYTILLLHKHCVDSQEPNVCVKDEQGVYVVDIYEGDSTNGDTTNGKH